jgi:hypothetical protein
MLTHPVVRGEAGGLHELVVHGAGVGAVAVARGREAPQAVVVSTTMAKVSSSQPPQEHMIL